jgi:hypothetical protein
VDNLNGRNESWSYRAVPLEFEFESGDGLLVEVVPQYEFLPAPFAIAPGVVLPVGGYHFTRVRAAGETSAHRAWQAGAGARFGTFYSGRLAEWENFVRWTSPRARWSAGLEFLNNFGHLREGNFVQRLWQTNFSFAWNPNIVLTSFIQYDTESQSVGANTRLRWTFKPGRDLFLVWNRDWKHLLYTPDLSLPPQGEFIAIKLRWTFRR